VGLLRRRIVLGVLRRRPDEIARRAASFRIHSAEGHLLVTRLGEAFIAGFNAMLERGSLGEVAALGAAVEPHFRPFFFEGAAMGFLPRGYHASGCAPEHAERELLSLGPGFRFLYYVGLGFWYGFRHRRRPERLQVLAPHLDPRLFPLCYDGYGFKLGFFDYRPPLAAPLVERLARCPAAARSSAWQGLGRAAFFLHMDDEPGFRALLAAAPPGHSADVTAGRALAVAFTGVDRPDGILRHLAEADGEDDLAARLLGVTWGLTARHAADPAYLASCLARTSESPRALLRRLPELCGSALTGAASYADWQARTREAAREAYGEMAEGWTARDG
jgi:hypothetical protein